MLVVHQLRGAGVPLRLGNPPAPFLVLMSREIAPGRAAGKLDQKRTAAAMNATPRTHTLKPKTGQTPQPYLKSTW